MDWDVFFEEWSVENEETGTGFVCFARISFRIWRRVYINIYLPQEQDKKLINRRSLLVFTYAAFLS